MYKDYRAVGHHCIVNELTRRGEMDEQVFRWFVLHRDLVNNVAGLRMMSWDRFIANRYDMRDLPLMQSLGSRRSGQTKVK